MTTVETVLAKLRRAFSDLVADISAADFKAVCEEFRDDLDAHISSAEEEQADEAE